MKKYLICLVFTLAGLLQVSSVNGQEVHLFRIVGPADTRILSVNPNGSIIWTNSQPGSTFTFQTAITLNGTTNWIDYVQMTGTAGVSSNKLFDPNPPSGMVFIPPGSFMMGAETNVGHESLGNDVPQHRVQVSAFYMERFKVTKPQWDQVVAWATNHGYSDLFGLGLSKATNHPVRQISWINALKWCNARSEMEGLTPCYYSNAAQTVILRAGYTNIPNALVNWSANGYRLPTEAEWEKAARGGLKDLRFQWGNQITHSNANYVGYPEIYSYDVSPTSGYNPAFTNATLPPYTSPVNYFAPNKYGLYDMGGNQFELCWDSLDNSWYSNPLATNNDCRGPATPSTLYRVIRGGDASNYAEYVRCANRTGDSWSDGSGSIRCVRRAD